MPTATIDEPEVIWEANAGGQWRFLSCPFWEALADGDRGGGKSDALIACFLSYVGVGFGRDWRGIIFRMTYPELDDLVEKSRRLILRAYPDATYNKSDHEWTFPDGERLLFRHLDNLKAYFHYHGASYPFIGFDELTVWPTSEPYEAMLSCSRPTSSRPDMPLMVRSTTNSYGVGFSWVKSRFVTGKKPNVPYGEPGMQRIRIPIRWRDNIHFVESDPQYHSRLASTITNEGQRKAWLENSWDIISGGRFSDVFRESIHVMEPFNIPQAWRLDRSFDWGSSAPFCTLWYAESNGESIPDGRSWPKGTLFVIHEDYGCQGDMLEPGWKPNVGLGLGPVEIARRTKDHEARLREWGVIVKQPQPGPADDPMFDVSRGRSMASMMSDLGVVWMKPSKGPGSRITGWQILEDKLKASMQWPMEQPGIFFFDTCRHLIRTLPAAQRDAKKIEDIDMAEDHALDSLRYRLISYTGGSILHGVSL